MQSKSTPQKMRLSTLEAAVHRTKNALPEGIRVQVIGLLQERLAELGDLVTHAKQAHWNVKGPDFIALHELFDDVYTHAGEEVDLVAERIVQLGGTAEATARVVALRSKVPEYSIGLAAGKDHVEALSRSLAFVGDAVRKCIDRAGELDDMDTADILTEISRSIDKDLWFVEAHTQSDR